MVEDLKANYTSFKSKWQVMYIKWKCKDIKNNESHLRDNERKLPSSGIKKWGIRIHFVETQTLVSVSLENDEKPKLALRGIIIHSVCVQSTDIYFPYFGIFF